LQNAANHAVARSPSRSGSAARRRPGARARRVEGLPQAVHALAAFGVPGAAVGGGVGLGALGRADDAGHAGRHRRHLGHRGERDGRDEEVPRRHPHGRADERVAVADREHHGLAVHGLVAGRDLTDDGELEVVARLVAQQQRRDEALERRRVVVAFDPHVRRRGSG
jgi:hypothetical protein